MKTRNEQLVLAIRNKIEVLEGIQMDAQLFLNECPHSDYYRMIIDHLGRAINAAKAIITHDNSDDNDLCRMLHITMLLEEKYTSVKLDMARRAKEFRTEHSADGC